MQLIRDLIDWVKEWNEWKMKDWLKAGIIALPTCQPLSDDP